MREKPNVRCRANANKNISKDPAQPAMQQGRSAILKRIGMCKSMSLCGDLKKGEKKNEEKWGNLRASEWLMKYLSVCVLEGRVPALAWTNISNINQHRSASGCYPNCPYTTTWGRSRSLHIHTSEQSAIGIAGELCIWWLGYEWQIRDSPNLMQINYDSPWSDKSFTKLGPTIQHRLSYAKVQYSIIYSLRSRLVFHEPHL